MFRLLFRRVRKRVMHAMISELYNYNDRDGCYDPIGSISRNGMLTLIDSLADGKFTPQAALTKHRQHQTYHTGGK